VKMLRHYHEIGLLEPVDVDADTGYRRYATEQIVTAQIIRRFRPKAARRRSRESRGHAYTWTGPATPTSTCTAPVRAARCRRSRSRVVLGDPKRMRNVPGPGWRTRQMPEQPPPDCSDICRYMDCVIFQRPRAWP